MILQANNDNGWSIRYTSVSTGLFAFIVISVALHLLLLMVQVSSSDTLSAHSGSRSLHLTLLADKPQESARKEAKAPVHTTAPQPSAPQKIIEQVETPPAQTTPVAKLLTPKPKPKQPVIKSPNSNSSLIATQGLLEVVRTTPQTHTPAPTKRNNEVVDTLELADVRQTSPAIKTPEQASSDSALKTAPEDQQAQFIDAQGLDTQLVDSQRNLTLSRINLLLTPHLQYPSRARRRGWEGEVLIGFHLSKTGLLENIHLARSSGYSLLDSSALNALIKITHIPLSTPGDFFQAMDLELPVIFQLTDS